MILAASGIILQNKKILLLQRSNYTENYPEFWGCPGGRAEKGETAEQNVIREVKKNAI
ncbi:MAG: NUDIX hydrolase [Lutibacter sp.]|nr:NUDIX hydrolase [Lutibacter sp.]